MPENVNTSILAIDTDTPLFQDDDRPIMVSVDHVSMVFNMASEQLNSLKEYAIKLAKRELFFEEFVALDDVSFQVRKGDVFGIMGTNGSGKSTVLKIIAGVLEPSKGSCTVNGGIAPLIELGAGFDSDLSARENIYLNGALLGYSKQFIDEHFEEIVSFAEIEKFLDMPLKNYSSGMVARIAFAIATVIVPEVLIVDEVLSVGDFMFQKKCEDRINELIEQHGVTVLIVSHSNAQVARLCNKAIWIEKGHVRLMGDAAAVCNVYGALGGRTGSTEAEHRVFEALVSSQTVDVPAEACQIVAGENSSAVNTRLVSETWGKEHQDALVLACDSTHVNSVVAEAAAAALGAPVVPVGREAISEYLEHLLDVMQPEELVVFDVGLVMEESLDQLKALPWSPRVTVVGVDKDPFAFSMEAYELGLERGWWGKDAAASLPKAEDSSAAASAMPAIAVVDFADNAVSMAVQPFLYAAGCPAFVLSHHPDHQPVKESFKHLQAVCDQQGVGTVYAIGPGMGQHFDSRAAGAAEAAEQAEGAAACCPLSVDEVVVVAAGGRSGELVDVARFACERLGGSFSGAIALGSSSRWIELQSAGSCMGHVGGALLLVDETALDSIDAALTFLGQLGDRVDNLVFVGDALIGSGLNERVFYSATQA